MFLSNYEALHSIGLKHQSVSDPTLAQAHKVATAIRLVDHAEHAQFGPISYERRRLWQLHYLAGRDLTLAASRPKVASCERHAAGSCGRQGRRRGYRVTAIR